ncbi:MAG TPA: hypothetical protein VKZ81_18390 [Pseudonocardia sp.]|uniref:hypothetical protein n=1 Tax=Pseudonocardia sp. TaxID=60912 RepID=UPI002B4B8825|nr:hypothetical protein [Pseudonocardia sp.]HLU57429.1 hypothetical protein [Pseudonocardia sp.]
MLKKAGIVVAAAAAGLLAVSPLAFAGDDHGKSKTKVEDVNSIDGSTHGGLLNVGGNNVAVPVNACDNHVPVNVLGVQVPLNDTHLLAALTGAAGLNSDVDADSDGDDTIDDSCKAAAKSGDSAEIDD